MPAMRVRTGVIVLNRAFVRQYGIPNYQTYKLFQGGPRLFALVFYHDDTGVKVPSGGKTEQINFGFRFYKGKSVRLDFEATEIDGEFALCFEIPDSSADVDAMIQEAISSHG
jgi:hypothetical protein